MADGADAGAQVVERDERWFRMLIEHGTDVIILFGVAGTVLYATRVGVAVGPEAAAP